jgi:nucleoside-diphosphate-sugar epimerase
VKVLVTGGGGFLGRALVRQLVQRGHDVRACGRGRYPELDALGVETARVDVRDRPAVRDAVRGAEVVIHAAAKAGVWGDPGEYHAINVAGTDNVVAACRDAGVRRLVYTSSPSAVFDAADHEGAFNDLPYPDTFQAAYPETKAWAERAVLAANASDLATVALRPHLIYGPGDPHLLPRLFDRARRGKLRIVGSGTNRVSVTFVENAARAHVDAAERLEPGAAWAGAAYFVDDGEPVALWKWLDDLLARVGLPPVRRRVGERAARVAGAVAERLWRVLPLPGEPPMTRFVAAQLARSHWYSPEPARAAFGFVPPISPEEAIRLTAEWWRPRLAGTP